jgi:hypothetical protein
MTLALLEICLNVLRVSSPHAAACALFELALIGVTGHSVADVHCR